MSESAPIRVLPQALVARIAAGEVITRPRAVVKELIDNAIDAGATDIVVDSQWGGFQQIDVHDNGSGIRAADTPLALTRHATSKLASLADLPSIATLGFRGEALASIAAVADIEIRTQAHSETVGTKLTSVDGVEACVPSVRRQGTSVTVRRLFDAFPVRREIADRKAESRAIRTLIAQLALSRPDIAFSLDSEGRRLVSTGGGSLRKAFAEINGVDALPFLLDLGPLELRDARVSGIISAPTATAHRSRRDGIVLSVNGRLCGVADIQRAIERAYAEVLPRNRFPHVVLAIAVPPERVDVNIHPAKEQVALLDGKELAERLEAEIRALLGRTAHLIAERHSLALEVGSLPGLRAAEAGTPYGAGEWGARTVEPGSLPRLRVVGHIDDTLIVCESDVGTLLIDQHRAHERVIYERLLEHESVDLPVPVVLALPRSILTMLDTKADDLRGTGWDWEDIGANQLFVRACPTGLAPDDLLPIAERFTSESSHTILAATACHAAIRKRRPLSPDAAVELLEALTRTATPTTCPHGQPIAVNLDRAFLERQFGWR